MGQFYEFFAGGGMARAGLGTAWVCLFANDFDYKKSRIYAKNWGRDVIKTADLRTLTPNDLPGRADLKGDRSGTFWPFWRLAQAVSRRDAHRISSCLKMFAARSPHTMGKTSRRFAPSSNKQDTGLARYTNALGVMKADAKYRGPKSALTTWQAVSEPRLVVQAANW